jgi:hypothetical protein
VRLLALPGVGLVLERPASSRVLLALVGVARRLRWEGAANDHARPTGTATGRPGAASHVQHAPPCDQG